MSARCPGRRGRSRVLSRRHPSGRRVPAQRSVSRRQPPARPDRLRAGVRGRPAARSGRSTARTRATSAAPRTAPTTPRATEIWQEGIRITPLKLYDRGEVRRDVLEMLVTNVRHPRDFRGDLAAMIGSAHVGERRLLALPAEFGWETTHAAIEAVLDGAERQTRAVIADWKDGVYRGEALLDDDGHGTRRHPHPRHGHQAGQRSDHRSVGFARAGRRASSTRPIPNMHSAVVVALAYLIDPHTPKNDGTFRPVEVIAKPGTVVWANEGAPVTLCTNHCGQEIIEAIIKALAPACPDRAMAGWGRRFRIAIQGRDPRTRQPFIWHMFQARPGGGASPVGDGWPGGGEWQAAGGIKFGSLEVDRGALSAVLPDATSSGRIPAATGSIAAARAACSRWWSRSTSRRSATPPATACGTAPAASSAARTGCRTATCCIPKAGRPRAQDQGSRHRDPAGRRARRPLGRRRRLGRPGRARRCRQRPRAATVPPRASSPGGRG